MFMQMGFRMDLRRCVGCHACEIACKNESQRMVRRRKVRSVKDDNLLNSSFFSMSCNHCENPVCISSCQNHCFKKRRDGIVVYDPTNCNSCKNCIGICPFEAISINPKTGKADKCNMCVDRLEKGLEPVCVSACSSKALQIVNLMEPLKENESHWITDISFANYTNPSVLFVKNRKVIRYMRKDGLINERNKS